MVMCFPHVTPTPPNTVSEIKSRSENNNNILKHCFTGSLNVNPLLCSSQSILFLIKYKLPRMFNALFMCLFKPLPFSHVFFYSSLSSVVLRVIFPCTCEICLHVYFISVLALGSSFPGNSSVTISWFLSVTFWKLIKYFHSRYFYIVSL